MRVAFITAESFTEKRHGGFGWLVRLIGGELARRGFEVYVIAWRDPGYPGEYVVDGVRVVTYEYDFGTRSVLRHLANYRDALKVIEDVDADVYISIEAMVETLLAELFVRGAKHIIWAQDPFDWRDYELMASVDPYYRISRVRFMANRFIFGMAYRRADLILTQARFYIDKLRRLYSIDPGRVIYLPNPVHPIPREEDIVKSEEPTICYLARMDPQKRYWLFFELARQFPEYRFIAMGKPSVLYEDRYREVVSRYRDLKNLEIKGFVSEGEKQEVLNRCWILVLPSIREGLPIAMLEALAHKCTLLSSVNPDGLTERFGYWARNDDFSKGLRYLLSGDKWRVLGQEGYRYVANNHRVDKVINELLSYINNVNA
ncbi:glycosyltransferase family 4 protein [Vulcanisaeta distributa]|uniref:Glycosyl transferase group 1 n=1 Tax=Vulcanisaeta distributa (strain DSM 14429 / JCM 11212 / NBRC 100878 / IC-017) TaxID=572478 RepID=E1QUC9_VULDI|nr:glycosyltransferase family 4 protein [Vulcanisaeta distributa]ADN49855.1 glycosyl transferase group 1 [Vulcanisaeta distributa DSM 14429]